MRGGTAAWRNTLATNEPQIKPGPVNNNYNGQHHTRNLWFWVSRLERELEEDHDKLVRVGGNIFGWSCGYGVGPAPVSWCPRVAELLSSSRYPQPQVSPPQRRDLLQNPDTELLRVQLILGAGARRGLPANRRQLKLRRRFCCSELRVGVGTSGRRQPRPAHPLQQRELPPQFLSNLRINFALLQIEMWTAVAAGFWDTG